LYDRMLINGIEPDDFIRRTIAENFPQNGQSNYF
jgi:hypothetical protein